MDFMWGAWLALGLGVFAPVLAQECSEQIIYSGNEPLTLRMDESSRTWPESPEWFANWGVQDGMEPPYVRLSGQAHTTRDWTGALELGVFPLMVNGGNLEMQVHPSQTVRFTVWLEGYMGASGAQSYDLPANQTTHLKIPVGLLGVAFPLDIQKMGVQLNQVPAYQYTTVLIDQIRLTCTLPSAHDPLEPSDSTTVAELLSSHYLFNELNPLHAKRPVDDSAYIPNYAYIIKNDSVYRHQKSQSTTGIVLSLDEFNALQNSLMEPTLSAKRSSPLWFHNLHVLSRGRLQDSLFANPQTLYEEGDLLAANTSYKLIPLLLADLDYESEACITMGDSAWPDTAMAMECLNEPFQVHRYTHVSLPVPWVNGSRVAIVNDPEFFTTNRHESLPAIELRIGEVWYTLAPRTSVVVEFPSAGWHAVLCRFHRGSYLSENTVFVEVR